MNESVRVQFVKVQLFSENPPDPPAQIDASVWTNRRETERLRDEVDKVVLTRGCSSSSAAP